jgi:hypothetical protein
MKRLFLPSFCSVERFRTKIKMWFITRACFGYKMIGCVSLCFEDLHAATYDTVDTTDERVVGQLLSYTSGTWTQQQAINHSPLTA